MPKIALGFAERFIAIAAVASVAWMPASAAPRWEPVGSFKADNGADAGVWIDLNSLIRTQRLSRVWVVFDYSEFQVGDWYAEPGTSKAYMSTRQFSVVDCATKDMGFGTYHALDGPRGTGSVVHSVSRPVPAKADQPVAPGSVAEAISEAVCKQRR